MEIRKRNGKSVPFQQEKIFNAMKKAFDGQGREIGSRELNEILAAVLDNLAAAAPLTVERVQDEVERTLMERGYYEVAKAYILYREKRSALRRVRHTIAQTVGDNSLDEVLRRIQMDFTEEVYSLAALQMKFESFCRPGMTEDERAEALTKAAVELTTAEAPKWEFIAARLLNHSFRCRNAQEWEGRGVGDLYGRLRYLTDKGLYGDYILAHYTHEEIAVAEGFLCPERDELFTYSGLDLLLKRYVIQTRSRVPLETPQEMFLGIALHLAMNEGSDRMGWVKRFYDMLRRNTFIGDCYNEFQERKDAPTLLRVMMANYILEGIYFYSGFMFFYNLSRNGKMSGSAQEIRYINRDENTHLWLFRNIITELQKEQPELFTAESVQALREMMREGVEQEIAWGHYVIGDDIPGLNRQMISDYIRYLGNLRWTSLGYPALYPGFESEPESMEWVSQYADANMVKTDFFEARSTAYAKSTALIDDL